MAALRVALGSPRRAIPRTMSATSTAAAAAASARGTRPGASCSVRGAGRTAGRFARLNCEKNPFFMTLSGTANRTVHVSTIVYTNPVGRQPALNGQHFITGAFHETREPRGHLASLRPALRRRRRYDSRHRGPRSQDGTYPAGVLA